MPTPTYVPLATLTLGSASATVTFSSIPATFRDLVLVWTGTTAGNTDIVLSANADTSNTYITTQMFGTGSVTVSTTFTRTGAYFAFGNTTLGNAITSVMDYAQTNKHKTFVGRYNTAETAAQASRFPSNDAINTLAVRATSQNFTIGSTFSLYGVN